MRNRYDLIHRQPDDYQHRPAWPVRVPDDLSEKKMVPLIGHPKTNDAAKIKSFRYYKKQNYLLYNMLTICCLQDMLYLDQIMKNEVKQ